MTSTSSQSIDGLLADPSRREPCFTRVVACIGSDAQARKVIRHASLIAKALSVPLMLLRVFETRSGSGMPLDPVDWEIHRREAFAQVEALVEEHRSFCERIEAEIVEGHAAEQISFRARSHPSELTVLGTPWRVASGRLGLGQATAGHPQTPAGPCHGIQGDGAGRHGGATGRHPGTPAEPSRGHRPNAG